MTPVLFLFFSIKEYLLLNDLRESAGMWLTPIFFFIRRISNCNYFFKEDSRIHI